MKKEMPRRSLRLNLETIRLLTAEEMYAHDVHGGVSNGLSQGVSKPTTTTNACSFVQTGFTCNPE
jgi:hypothetical protein